MRLKGIGVTIDTGHYHPTEDVADKITALVPFVEAINLHLTRGIRWDSDHCLITDDNLRSMLQEIKRQDLFNKKVHLGLDFFDATINRVTSWIIGCVLQAEPCLKCCWSPAIC